LAFFILLGLLALLPLAPRPAVGVELDPRYMVPLEELRPGMKAWTLTVIRGAEIARIPTTIVAVLYGYGFDNRAMIVTKMEGAALDITNGSAGGMSGSPVVLEDGRLVGAHSGGWGFTSHRYGIVTPIEQMLSAFDESDPRFNLPFELGPVDHGFDTRGVELIPMRENPLLSQNRPVGEPGEELYALKEPFELEGRRFRFVHFVSTEEAAERASRQPKTLVVRYAAPPLVVTAPNPAMAEEFGRLIDRFSGRRRFAQIDLREIAERIGLAGERLPEPDLPGGQGGGTIPLTSYGENVQGPEVMEPGTTLGMPFSIGDLNAFTYGTLTYVDQKGNFLTFGHPFMRDGATTFAASKGYIIVTPPNLRRNDKIGVALDIVGAAFQDRGPAVAGTFGVMPPMSEVQITVRDMTTGEQQTLRSAVVNHRFYFPIMAASMVGTAMSNTTSMDGEAMVTVTWRLDYPGMERITRTNLFFSKRATLGAAEELAEILTFGVQNERKQVFPERVQVEVLVEPGRNTIRLGRIQVIDEEGYKKLAVKEGWRVEGLPEEVKSLRKQGNTVTISRGKKYWALIRLLPWRSEPYWAVVPIRLPFSPQRGQFQLTFYGGSEYAPPSEELAGTRSPALETLRRRLKPFPPKPAASLEEELRHIADLPTSEELVMSVVFAGRREQAGIEFGEPLPNYRRILHLGGVVEGAASLTLNVR